MSYFIEFSSHPQADPHEIRVSRDTEDADTEDADAEDADEDADEDALQDADEDAVITLLSISYGAYAERTREYPIVETFTVTGTDDVKFLNEDGTLSRVATGEEWVLSSYTQMVKRDFTLWVKKGIAYGTFWIVVDLAGTQDQRPPESDFCEIRIVEAES